MVNRLFSFMSQASGTTLVAMVVGAMSLHAHNGGANAGISSWTVAAVSQSGLTRQDATDTNKADSAPGMWNPTHPHVLGMWNPTHPHT